MAISVHIESLEQQGYAFAHPGKVSHASAATHLYLVPRRCHGGAPPRGTGHHEAQA